jgi:hypothetical protein
MDHQVPTHLHVDDRLFGVPLAGLPWIGAGALAALLAGTSPPLIALGPAAQWAAVLLCALAGLGGAVVRPQGRDPLAWAAVAVRYLVLPKLALWRPVGVPTLSLADLDGPDGSEQYEADAATRGEDDADEDW